MNGASRTIIPRLTSRHRSKSSDLAGQLGSVPRDADLAPKKLEVRPDRQNTGSLTSHSFAGKLQDGLTAKTLEAGPAAAAALPAASRAWAGVTMKRLPVRGFEDRSV